MDSRRWRGRNPSITVIRGIKKRLKLAYFAGAINLAEEERQDRHDNKIHPTREIRELIELENRGYEEKQQLDDQDCDGRNCEVVRVKNIHCHVLLSFSVFFFVHSRAPYYYSQTLNLESDFSAAANSMATDFHRSMFTFTRFPRAQPVHLICLLRFNNFSTPEAVFTWVSLSFQLSLFNSFSKLDKREKSRRISLVNQHT